MVNFYLSTFKKVSFLLVALLFFASISFSQITMSGTNRNGVCTGNFYDPGGTGNYANNINNVTQTFTPSAGNRMSFNFTDFDTEAGYDFLYIYDGNSIAAPLIGTYSGDLNATIGTIASTANDGSLTFRFKSDGNTVRSGWVATISCVPVPYRAQFVSIDYGASQWCVGETRSVTVKWKNTGSSVWTDAGADINIGLRWNEDPDYGFPPGNIGRVNAGNLAPGATGTYVFNIVTPVIASGTDNLKSDIVYEGVAWFRGNNGGVGPGNVEFISPNITINTLPGSPTATTPQVFCGDKTVADLVATGSNIKWYASATGGTALASSIVITNGTHYYASQTNASGCESATRKDVTVSVNPAPTTANAGADQTNAATCGITSVTLAGNTATVGSGVWSIVSGTGGSIATPSNPTSTFSGVAGNAYTLRWKISSGSCTSEDDVNITFNQNPTIANAGADQIGTVTCGLTAVILNGNAPAVGTGLWSIVSGAGGSFSSNTARNATFTGLSGVSYVLKWTISNAPCTASSDDVSITFNTKPTANPITQVGGLNSVCATNTLNLTSNGSVGTVTWSSSNNTIATVSNTGVVTGLVAGNTNISYTVTAANGCTTTSANYAITVIASPTGNFIATENSGGANDNNICIGSTVTFTAPAGYGSYIFKSGASVLQTGTNNVYNASTLPLGVSSITVDVANSLNCATSFGPIAITVNSLPTPTLSANKTSICPGGSVIFTAMPAPSAGYIYNFKVGGSSVQTGASNIYSPTGYSGGAVTVDFTNANGCIGTSAPLTVAINALPSGTISTTETSGTTADDKKVCIGDNVTFTATAGAGNTFDFKINGVSTYTASNIFSTNFATAGTYIVTVDVTNSSGCTAAYGPTQVITVYAPPSGSLIATENSGTANNYEICPGSSVSFNATAGTGNNYKFYLNGAGAPLYNGSANTFSTTTLVNGDYFTVTVTNANGCAAIYTSLPITVVPAPTGTLLAVSNPTTTICFGGIIDFEATAGFTNYNFKVNGTTFANGPSNTSSRSGFANGDIVTVVVSNSATCTALFNSLTVTVNPLPTGSLVITENSGLTPDDGKICTGTNVKFTANAGFSLYNFKLNGTTVQYNSTNTFSSTSLITGDVVSVEVTNASNCTATLNSFTITVSAYDVVAPITGDTEVCVGNSIKLADATASGSWSSSQPSIATVNNSGVVTGVSAGVVSISYTILNANGCATIVTKDVTVNAIPTVDNITGPAAVCVSSSIQLNNATNDGTWAISDATTATINSSGLVTGLTAGSVTITYTVINASNCTTIVSKNLTVNALPVVAAISGTFNVCVNSTTDLNNTTTGGVWSSADGIIATVNASTGLVTGVSSGTVTISYKVTNGTGCSTTITADIIVNALPVPTLDGPNPICLGSTDNVYTTEPGQFNYSWNVTNGTITSGGTSTDNTVTVSWLSAGAKGISVNYLDVNGCSGATSATVVNAPGSSPTITGPSSACQNSTGNIYNTQAGNIDYEWTINGGTITSGNGTESVTVTWNVAGPKSITVNYAAPGGCSAASPTIYNVTVNPLPTVVINTPLAVCSPSTVNLTAAAVTAGSTTGLTYTYFNDAAATIAYSTPATATAGTYYIKGTTAAGCIDIKPVTVTVNPTPSVIISDPSAVCSPSNVDLTAPAITAGSTSGLTFTYWTNATATSTFATPTSAGAGTYYIKGTTAAGCFDIKPVIVTVNPKPTVITNNPAAICSPSTVDLTLAAVTAGSTAGLTYTYWTNAAATIAYTTPTAASAGTYYIKGTTGAGCEDIKPVTVTVNPTPTLVITSPAAVCSPATVNLTAASITAGSTTGLTFTYWTNSTATTSYTTPTTAGAGTYYIKGTTAFGCFEIKPVIVTVNPTPTVVITNPAAVCSPSIVNLTLGSVSTGSTAGLTYTYWTNATATTAYSTPTTAGAGTYYIKGTTAAGCFDIKPVVVTVNPLPTATISGTANVCQNAPAPSITFTGSNGTAPYTFTYKINGGGNQNIISTGNTANVPISTGATGTFTYELISVKDNSSTQCSKNFTGQTALVTVKELPTITLLPYSSPVCQNDIVALTATSTGTPIGQSYNKASGPINIDIPDASGFFTTTPGQVVTLLNVSSLPSGAVISNIRVNLNITHPYDGDLNFNLKAPNGNVLNLINRVGGSGNNFSNTNITLLGGVSLPSNGAPYTGTYIPDASINIGSNPYKSNSTSFSELTSTLNGNWTLYAQDMGKGDEGTINSWSISFDYIVPSTNPVTWYPITDLYSDAGATVAYTGQALTTVYTKSSTSGTKLYTATATNSGGCTKSVQATIVVSPSPVVNISADYCSVAGFVVLTASSAPGVSFKWSTGENTSSIQVDVAGDYSVTATNSQGCKGTASISIANELVTNGDFEAGDNGFVTLYASQTGSFYNGSNASGLYPDGKYAVDNSAWSPSNGVGYHPAFHGKDHTTGSGKFMMINGSQALVKIWEQTVQVLPNTTYYFSAWGMNLNPGSPARLRFTVNSTQSGSTLDLNAAGVDKPTTEAEVNTGNWNRFYGTWTSGPSTTSAVISIINLNTDPGGNDFGLDDISFATLSTFIDLVSAAGTDAQTVCVNTAITDIVYRAGNGDINGPSVTGLPAGVTKSFAGDKLTISGTPSVPGFYTYTVTTTGCAPYTVTGTIKVQTQTISLSAGSSSPSICINSPLPAIEYTVGGSATGATLSSGAWPNGVSGAFSAGKFKITGTPTVAGVYPYSITTTGICKDSTISGTITVNKQEISLTSGLATQNVCLNEDITAIVYSVSGTGTGAGVTGLPPGVSGFYSGGIFIISGKPLAPASGTYNYSVTTTGTCSPAAILTGSITINPSATINLTSGVGTDVQSVCINSALATTINYNIGGGGTNATVSGLPTGVTGSFSAGTLTISGTPIVAGTFTYTITTTGTCAQATKTGTITVNAQTLNLTSGSASPTVCIGSTLTNIVFTIGGTSTSAVLTGTLPNGITGSFSGNSFTISGSPTELGSFSYTITTTGTCATTSFTGTIIVNNGSIGGTIAAPLAICSGSTGNLNLSGNTGNVIRWESSIDYGGTWSNIANTTTTLPYTNITIPTQYRALIKSGSCNAVYSSVVLVSIRNYWTGLVNNDWLVAGNWSDNQVPSMSCPNVYIPNQVNNPVLGNPTSPIGSLFISSGANLVINNNGHLIISGSITSPDGAIDATSGTLETNGGTQELSGKPFVNHNINKLIVSGTTLNIKLGNADSVNILEKLSFENNPNATLNTRDNITLKSGDPTTASVGILQTGNVITGTFGIERYIRYFQNWNLLSAPIRSNQSLFDTWQEGGASKLVHNGFGTQITGAADPSNLGLDTISISNSVKYYETSATTGQYVMVRNTKVEKANRKEGFFTFVRGDRGYGPGAAGDKTTLRSKGNIYDATPNNSPVFNYTVATNSFIQIGNPYASAVDLMRFANTNDIETNFYFWDPTLSGSYNVGGYQTIAAVTGGKVIPGSELYDTTKLYPNMQSGQAIFVRTIAANPEIHFNEPMKADGSLLVSRGNNQNEPIVMLSTRIYTSDGKVADGNIVVLADNYSNVVDRYDAVKITNSGINFGLLRNGKKLAVEARQPVTSSDTLFYNMSNLRNGNYNLGFTVQNFNSNLEATLIDNYLQTRTPVSLSSETNVKITADANVASKAANRFMLVFKAAAGPLPVTLTSISANRNTDRSIAIRWTVENEVNIEKYEVERSADGRNFTGIISAAATNSNVYTKNDLSPLAADNFYRIKAITVGGYTQYSAIVKVAPLQELAAITVFPNPVVDQRTQIKFVNQTAGTYEIKLYNQSGQLMQKENVKVSGTNFVKTFVLNNNFAGGVYQLTILNPDGSSSTQQLIIK